MDFRTRPARILFGAHRGFRALAPERMTAAKLGIERIVLKNNVMLAWFIADRNHPFFQSDRFGTILQQLAARRDGISLQESAGKLHFKVKDVKSVQAAAKVLSSFLV